MSTLADPVRDASSQESAGRFGRYLFQDSGRDMKSTTYYRALSAGQPGDPILSLEQQLLLGLLLTTYFDDLAVCSDSESFSDALERSFCDCRDVFADYDRVAIEAYTRAMGAELYTYLRQFASEAEAFHAFNDIVWTPDDSLG